MCISEWIVKACGKKEQFENWRDFWTIGVWTNWRECLRHCSPNTLQLFSSFHCVSFPLFTAALHLFLLLPFLISSEGKLSQNQLATDFTMSSAKSWSNFGRAENSGMIPVNPAFAQLNLRSTTVPLRSELLRNQFGNQLTKTDLSALHCMPTLFLSYAVCNRCQLAGIAVEH